MFTLFPLEGHEGPEEEVSDEEVSDVGVHWFSLFDGLKKCGLADARWLRMMHHLL
jgi:hypothetical protein